MSIATAIQNAQQKVANAYVAISNKGGTLPATQDLSNMPTAISSIPSGSTPSGKYQLLDRVKDDSNNEIGTVSGFFTDANDTEYAVVCLDAQYRIASAVYCSKSSQITDLPMYSNNISSSWITAKETATFNTQKILDYCTASGYTSSACSGCRSHSFTIEGVTYYGQLPNMKEMFDMSTNFAALNTKDTTASSYTSTNFATARNWWSSTQSDATYGWSLGSYGNIYRNVKLNNPLVCPILEIPNT